MRHGHGRPAQLMTLFVTQSWMTELNETLTRKTEFIAVMSSNIIINILCWIKIINVLFNWHVVTFVTSSWYELELHYISLYTETACLKCLITPSLLPFMQSRNMIDLFQCQNPFSNINVIWIEYELRLDKKFKNRNIKVLFLENTNFMQFPGFINH